MADCITAGVWKEQTLQNGFTQHHAKSNARLGQGSGVIALTPIQAYKLTPPFIKAGLGITNGAE